MQVAQSNQRIAVSQYEKSVQTAFKEVADVLADRAQWGERLSAQTSMVANTQKRLICRMPASRREWTTT